MNKRDLPTCFLQFCGGLHQDALLVSGGDVASLARHCAGFVEPAQRPPLATYLKSLTAQELGVALKRAEVDTMVGRRGAEPFRLAAIQAVEEMIPQHR